jgi:4-oxalocrotonate tautomerase
MPIVTIQLMEGRPPERIEAMQAAVASAIGAPIESVRILVREMQEHQYSVGGRPIRVVKAERAAQSED